MNYHEKLDGVFSKLSDSIAYLKIGSDGIQYKQKTGSLGFSNIYFDFTKSRFISARTIVRNKEILKKLADYYKKDYLISYLKIENGFNIIVYNEFGDIVYKTTFRFYDKGLFGFFTHLRLMFLFPELIR